jgi:hypothetical protein
LTGTHLERLERDGYTIVEGVFDAAFADAVLADLARLERELGEGPGKNIDKCSPVDLLDGTGPRRVLGE